MLLSRKSDRNPLPPVPDQSFDGTGNRLRIAERHHDAGNVLGMDPWDSSSDLGGDTRAGETHRFEDSSGKKLSDSDVISPISAAARCSPRRRGPGRARSQRPPSPSLSTDSTYGEKSLPARMTSLKASRGRMSEADSRSRSIPASPCGGWSSGAPSSRHPGRVRDALPRVRRGGARCEEIVNHVDWTRETEQFPRFPSDWTLAVARHCRGTRIKASQIGPRLCRGVGLGGLTPG